jgi:pyruvate kinase
MGRPNPRRQPPSHVTRAKWDPTLAPSIDSQAIRRTGIVCTIGPESADVHTVVNIRKAGMNIMRLNCAHYTQEVSSPG